MQFLQAMTKNSLTSWRSLLLISNVSVISKARVMHIKTSVNDERLAASLMGLLAVSPEISRIKLFQFSSNALKTSFMSSVDKATSNSLAYPSPIQSSTRLFLDNLHLLPRAGLLHTTVMGLRKISEPGMWVLLGHPVHDAFRPYECTC